MLLIAVPADINISALASSLFKNNCHALLKVAELTLFFGLYCHTASFIIAGSVSSNATFDTELVIIPSSYDSARLKSNGSYSKEASSFITNVQPFSYASVAFFNHKLVSPYAYSTSVPEN